MDAILAKIAKLRDLPSFTRAAAQKLGVSGESLGYYVHQGLLRRIGPGIFCDPSTLLETEFKWHDLIRIAFSIENGVICQLSALDIHGLTQEIPREHWIAIPHQQRAPRVPNTKFVRYRNHELGRTTFRCGKFKIAIYDKERTVIDAFRALDKEVAIKALQSLAADGLNYAKMKAYCDALGINIDPYILAVTT